LDYHYYLSPRTRLQVEGNWINSSFIIENSGGFGFTPIFSIQRGFSVEVKLTHAIF
jgi:hypothetical protein